MNIDQFLSIFTIVVPILLGTMGTFYSVIALRGIITRRPFLVSYRWLLCLNFVIFIPSILLFLFIPVTFLSETSLPGESPFLLLVKWLMLAVFTFSLVIGCFVLKGYSAYGVSDITLREALIATLEKLQLSYEETLSSIHLTSIRHTSIRLTSVDADLQVGVVSWLGSGMIKIKQREHRTLLTQIVSEMNTYFRMSSTPSNLTPCIIELVLAIPMFGLGVGLTFLLFKFA